MNRKLELCELSYETFKTFGEFVNLIDAENSSYHAGWGFYPDMIKINMNSQEVSCSINIVEGKSDKITRVEYHNHTQEGILPLDKDILIIAGPAHWENKIDDIKLFKVPKGTLVTLNKGVLHGAPMSFDGTKANVLIMLPERTYANDCVLIDLQEEDQLIID